MNKDTNVKLIGIIRETKPHESRVALTPQHVCTLISDHGCQVFVQSGAGGKAGYTDQQYLDMGATLYPTIADIYARSHVIVKMKNVGEVEYPLIQPHHVILGNIHPAADPGQVRALLDSKATVFAMEETRAIMPMSEIAGEIAAFEGLRLMSTQAGNHGYHWSRPSNDFHTIFPLVIGLGNAGRAVVRTLLRLGLDVRGYHTGRSETKIKIEQEFRNDEFSFCDDYDFAFDKKYHNLIFNCTLWDKSRKDHIIRREELHEFPEETVIVDVSCDEAGAIETSRPTSWANPTYIEEGILHFCVDNMPSAVAHDASRAYADAIMCYIQMITDETFMIAEHHGLRNSLVCSNGMLVHFETVTLNKWKEKECTSPLTAAQAAVGRLNTRN